VEDLELIAYKGERFTIEWYRDESGSIPACEYFNGLDKASKVKLYYLLARMGDFGTISDKTKFNHEGDQIYAFKPQPERFLCFFQQGMKIIITSAFRKRQPKLPINEKVRALICRADYLNRIKTGSYYHGE